MFVLLGWIPDCRCKGQPLPERHVLTLPFLKQLSLGCGGPGRWWNPLSSAVVLEEPPTTPCYGTTKWELSLRVYYFQILPPQHPLCGPVPEPRTCCAAPAEVSPLSPTVPPHCIPPAAVLPSSLAIFQRLLLLFCQP